MGNSVRSKPGQDDAFESIIADAISDPSNKVGTQSPLQAEDLFDNIPKVHDSFGTNNVRPTMGETNFDPSQFEYAKDANPFGNQKAQESANESNQPSSDKWGRGLKLLGTNAVSAFGQGLLSTFDLVGAYNTAKGLATGSNDDFNSGFMGIFSSKDLNDWAKGIQENNKIFEQDPESTSPGDAGWWANKMLPQLGTMIGTAAAALGTTAAIEAGTGGAGTTVAAANLFEGIKNLWGAAKTGEIVKGGMDLVKGMKGAAIMYSSIARYSEARFEAQNNFQNTYDKLSQSKKADGTPFTEEEKQKIAGEGAKVDFGLTMAQLPLDILAMRTMVFNPLAGTAESGLERGLEKVAGAFGQSTLGKAAGWATTHAVGSTIEGLEAGAIPIFQEEGEHHAMVLAGLDSDKSSWTDRVGKVMGSAEFTDMAASGILGSFVIGPIMNASKTISGASQKAAFNEKYKDYVENVSPYNNMLANSIAKQDADGNYKASSLARKSFSANQVLDRLHLDTQAGKTSSFDAYTNFLKSTLDQVNSGNTDNIKDLFGTPDAKQLEQIKEEYKGYIDDASKIKDIYNEVGQRYNRNFVPLITMQHFGLNNMLSEYANTENAINAEKAKFGYYNLLSTQGQQIHDIDYQVQSLAAEKKRLTDSYANNSNDLEKENINKVLENTNQKLTDLHSKLGEIQQDDTYDTATKEKDNDILNARYDNINYLQAIHYKENLENNIALQRKNIALWNNPKYTKKQTIQAIPKARTKDQVRNNVEAVAKEDKGKVAPEIIQAAKQREAEIEADNNVDTTDNQVGNSNLFDEDTHAFADQVIEAANTPTNVEQDQPNEDHESDGKIVASFSPQVYDFDKSPDEAKQKVINGVKGLISKLGENPNFEDLVRRFIDLKGADSADKTFEALKYGWKANGKNLSEEEATNIYDKIFGDPSDELMAGASQLIVRDESELVDKNTDVTEDVVAEQGEPDGIDTNNQVIYKYNGKVTGESAPKMAYISRLSNLIKTILEDGSIQTSYEYTEDELNTGQYVDSLKLLDPDTFNEGTNLEIKIPTNFNNILVPIYNIDGTKGKAITFGQWVSQESAKNNLSLEEFSKTQEYKDKIPMIIYNKKSKEGEKGVAFVHDVNWYHPIRFNQDKPGEMKEAIQSTREIRQELLDSKSNSIDATITGKRQTTFEGLIDKNKNNELTTIKEANPQAQLAVYINGEFKQNKSRENRLFPNDGSSLINNSEKPFARGQVLDIRRYGSKDGKPTYVALNLFKNKIDNEAKRSVFQAISIYVDKDNPKNKAARDHIKSVMGLDIGTTVGLKNYLSHFIDVFDPNKSSTNKEIEDQAKSSLATSTPYIAFLMGGNIVYGQAGTTMYVDNNKKSLLAAQYEKQGLSPQDALNQATENSKVNSRFINASRPDLLANAMQPMLNPITVRQKEANGYKDVTYPKGTGMFGWYENNLSLANYTANKPVVTIDANNTTKVNEKYHDYLMNRFTTNVKSYNIGDEKNPNYVTNIQPMITYDSNKRLNSEVGENKQEDVIVKENSPVNPIEVKTDGLDEATRKLIEEATSRLGNDLGKNTAYNMSPVVLTDEAKDVILEDINKIAGLDPIQQEAVTNFIFNNIIERVNFESGIVQQNQLDKEIFEAFSKIIDTRKEDNTYIKNLQSALTEDNKNTLQPLIDNFKYRVERVSEIENNYEQFRKIAYAKVDKYTGITTDRKQLDIEEGENEYGDKDTENPTDFWTDVLTESPEGKVTYAMRRFFGQIKKYDSEGNQLKGFLNLPLYSDSSEIIRNLMRTLSDVPSDFKSMMDVLEASKDKYTWMQEVINRLNDPKLSEQKKNQFITAMSHTKLRTTASLITQDKNKNWVIKLIDDSTNGVPGVVREAWENNLEGNSDFSLALINRETGNYYLNDKKAEVLIHKFESWLGINVKPLIANLDSIRDSVKSVTTSSPITITPANKELLSQLKTNLVNKGDRMQFSLFNRNFQITSIGNDKYKIAPLTISTPSKDEMEEWLKGFGITLTPKTLEVLKRDGLYHNYKQRKPDELFDTGVKTNGLFGILYNDLKNLVNTNDNIDFSEDGNSPLRNSVVTSLAKLEAQYNTTEAPFGFRVLGKSYYALTANKFITDRARDLKSNDSALRDQLAQISFSKNSLWLTLLNDPEFREHKFVIKHDSPETLKQIGKKSFRSRAGIIDISDMDQEIAKISKFFKNTQGSITYGSEGSNNYPGTSIPLRMATMAGLTSSDKSIMMDIGTGVLDLGESDLKDGMSDELVKALYEQLVKPELSRIIRYSQQFQNGKKTNITSYDQGARLFYMIPEMNNVMYSSNLKLVDAIRNKPSIVNELFIESNKDIIKDINDTIKKHVEQLVQEKLTNWKNNNIVDTKTDELGKETNTLNFVDSKYLNKFSRVSAEDKIKFSAMDYEINSLIANANNFMLFAGDPALYYKSSSTDVNQQIKDTFVNVTKRLANQIAPGVTLANSKNEKYIQLFLEDRKSTANNIDYLEKLYGVDGAAKFRNIKGSDAEEYTTWKEHLDILAKLGKTSDFMLDITPTDISTTRRLLSSGKELSDEQMSIVRKVMQPLKPVYTGQLYDKDQDVMRTVYIKSSSFPLIPQLTKGFEIDKLRVAMERIQDSQNLNVRASYQTANKVGSLNNAAKIWDENGNINQDNLDKLGDSSLILDRSNFRIQQEVPFKSDKNKVDTVTLGTQLMKLLFGDGVMNLNGFKLGNKEYSGKDLHQEYTNTFISLIQEKKHQLFNELGLDKDGKTIDPKVTITKLQNLLESEAIKRGYPLQDIKALKIDSTGNFTLPLWSSTNSNRYESMLNSIISHRMVAIKLPGTSLVTGSEEGFKIAKKEEGDLTKQEASDIIFTSAWNGKELQSTRTKDSKLQSAQVFLPSKFRDNEGNLVDLMQDKYINNDNGHLTLKEEMFDKELLSSLSFRIPTSGHQSGSKIEIAGFLPHTMGDLIIVPNTFTTQKGLDFDIDKENLYNLWTRMNADGKFEVLNEKHRTEILDNAIKTKEGLTKDIADTIAPEYNEDEINEDSKLSSANSTLNERLLHNKIINITRAVYENPSNEMQSKINKTLSTQYAEDQADMIDGLINKNKKTILSPLSSEYQKQAMLTGASGKTGTGAYSLDVVFHALAQQIAINGKPIELNAQEGEGEDKRIIDKVFKFGDISSHSTLGNTNTVDGDRSIADVNAERQNIAVDNASLQVMGKVNINDLTMDVDKVFNLLGIDKGSDGNSISFLFLSQPIIREYVAQMKNANSIMAEYENDKEGKIVSKLLNKYDPREELPEDYWDTMSSEMNNTNFINALSTETPDGQLQAAVLRRFMEMKKYGIAIRGIQTAINFKNNSLGKSFFDVIEKRNALNKLGNNIYIKDGAETVGTITGVSNLIGDYESVSNVEGNTKEGYTNIGDFFVKPNTIMGAFNIEGVNTAYNLWGKHFPYDTPVMQGIFDEILSFTGSGDMSAVRTVEAKQEIFRHIKKYLSSSNKNGIVGNLDNVNEERKRLYIDSETNTSLAKYLQSLKNINDNEVVNRYIKTNKLLNSFEYNINKDGTPSIIRYNNASGEQFDEQFLYEALSSLLVKNGRNGTLDLPEIGNKKYTFDTLAQDLIAYSFLGNSTQEAVQFTKYVPVSYLNAVGYSKWLKNNLENILGGKANSFIPENQKHLISEFSMQFAQHLANKVKVKYSDKNWNTKTKEATFTGKKDLSGLQTFQLMDNTNPTFVSIYNPFNPKTDKQQLYWFDGEKYTRVPTLGMFGMDEYQQGQGIGQSIIGTKIKVNINPQESIQSRTEEEVIKDPFDVGSKSLSNVVDNIIKSGIPGLSDLAKEILPFLGNTTIDFATQIGDKTNFNAIYLHDDDAIYVQQRPNNHSNEAKARIILEEVVHSLTANQIKPYIKQNQDGTVDVSEKAPSYVTSIVSLYNDIRSKSDQGKLKEMLDRINANQGITIDELKNTYGLKDIFEFMAHAFTNKEFQKYLSKEEFKQSGQTLLDRFKEAIKNILTKLGVNFDSNTATAQAINSIFEFIEEENKNKISKENQDMWDDSINKDQIPPLDLFDNNDEEPIASLSFPEKTLNIQDEKCI